MKLCLVAAADIPVYMQRKAQKATHWTFTCGFLLRKKSLRLGPRLFVVFLKIFIKIRYLCLIWKIKNYFLKLFTKDAIWTVRVRLNS